MRGPRPPPSPRDAAVPGHGCRTEGEGCELGDVRGTHRGTHRGTPRGTSPRSLQLPSLGAHLPIPCTSSSSQLPGCPARCQQPSCTAPRPHGHSSSPRGGNRARNGVKSGDLPPPGGLRGLLRVPRVSLGLFGDKASTRLGTPCPGTCRAAPALGISRVRRGRKPRKGNALSLLLPDGQTWPCWAGGAFRVRQSAAPQPCLLPGAGGGTPKAPDARDPVPNAWQQGKAAHPLCPPKLDSLRSPLPQIASSSPFPEPLPAAFPHAVLLADGQGAKIFSKKTLFF